MKHAKQIKHIFLIFTIITIIILPNCFQISRNISSYQDITQFPMLAKNLYVDFNTSMRAQKYPNKINTRNKGLFSLLKNRYEARSFNKVIPKEICKVPKVFQYIWLGKKLPEQYIPFLETWLKYHPDWTFVFWVDNPENYNLGKLLENYTFDDVKKYLNNNNNNKEKRIVIDVKNLSFNNRKFFDATRNYGQRSDILKWEVVYRFGGAYIDVDFECTKPLDILNYMYDFYTGIQPLDTSYLQLGAAIFAACPGHPILKQCVDTIKDDWHNTQIVVSTGPLHFTKCFCQAAGQKGFIDVALPASYFYPCGYDEQKLPRKNWMQSESFGVHHWAGSWLKPEGWDPKTS